MLSSLGVNPVAERSTPSNNQLSGTDTNLQPFAESSSSDSDRENENMENVSKNEKNTTNTSSQEGEMLFQPQGSVIDPSSESVAGNPLNTKVHIANNNTQLRQQHNSGSSDAIATTIPTSRHSQGQQSTSFSATISSLTSADDPSNPNGHRDSFPMLYGLWYIDPADENKFIQHEMNRCVFRATIGCLVPGICFLSAGMDEWRRPDRNSIIAISCIASGVVTLVATFIMSMSLRWYKAKLADTASTETLYKHGSSGDGFSSINVPAALSRKMPLSGDGSDSVIDSNDGDSAMSCGEKISKWFIKNMATIHEWRCIVFHFWFNIVLSLIYREKQHHCRYEPTYPHNPENHIDCPLRLFWPIFFFPAFAVFVGQPRLVYVIVMAFCIAAITIAMLRYHNTSEFGLVVIYILLIALQVQAVVLKWFEERQSRHRFEAQMLLVQRLSVIREHAKSLADFVNSITPVYLKSRLSEDTKSSVVCIDNASQAMCLVMNIRNALQFMQSMLPSESASALAILSCQCETRSHSYSIHHIRTVGDTMYFVSNLFREDAPSGAAAAVDAIRFIEGLWEPCSALELCCGLSLGPLAGLPLGTTCIRYDIVGPALNDAQSLSLQCTSSTVAVRQKTLTAMQRLVTLDCKKNDEMVANGDDGEESSHQGGQLYFVRAVTGPNLSTLPGAVMDNERRSSEEISIESGERQGGGGEGIVHISHETGLVPGIGDKDVSLETYGCVFTRFSDKEVEVEAENLLRLEGKAPLTFVSGFFTMLCVLIICTVFDEGSIRDDLSTSKVQCFLALVGLGCLFFVITGVSAQVTSSALKTWQHLLLFAGCLMVYVAANLMRPSLVSDSTGFLVVCFCCGSLFIGASAPLTVGFDALMILLEVVLGLTINPVSTRIFFILPPVCGTVINSCLVYHKQDRKTLECNVKTLAAMQEIDCQDNIRAAVLRSVIPRQLQERMNKHALRGSSFFKCWGRDDCVVLTVSIGSFETEMVNHFNPSSSSATSLPLPQVSSPSVSELYEKAAATTGRVEAIVNECKYQSLDVVKVFGGTIMVAGPLDTPSRKRNSHHLQNAVSDALQTIEAMLQEQTLRFTAGLVFEQILNAARFSMFPTYELLGPAVNISRSLVAAAPAVMVVASERLIDLHQRELPVRPALAFEKPESWRIRGLGVLRVSRINLAPAE